MLLGFTGACAVDSQLSRCCGKKSDGTIPFRHSFTNWIKSVNCAKLSLPLLFVSTSPQTLASNVCGSPEAINGSFTSAPSTKPSKSVSNRVKSGSVADVSSRSKFYKFIE